MIDLATYARAAARTACHACVPLQDLTAEWQAEARALKEENPTRAAYVDLWAQRCAHFTAAVAAR